MARTTFMALLILLMTGSMVLADEPETGEIKGSLVIVGGRLEPDNKEVHEKFIELAMRYRNYPKEQIRVGILPTASSLPAESAAIFRERLEKYGVLPRNIHVIPVAVSDDKATKDVDESKWMTQSQMLELAQQVELMDAIWFVGGDQSKYVKALYDKNGNPTPVLKSIWEMYRRGGVLGGTSAGAAIMSDPMIGGGDSMGALKYGTIPVSGKNKKGVIVARGLGFFGMGLVDQHFSQRGRLGRLIVAAMNWNISLAFGVDENTAMIVDNRNKTIQVMGEGGVTILDLSKAKKTTVKSKTAYNDILLSYLTSGDIFDISTGEFRIQKREPLKSDDMEQIYGSSAIFENIKDAITIKLYGDQVRESRGIAIELVSDTQAKGYMLKFRKGPDTRILCGTVNGANADGAVKVHLDIIPITLIISK